VGRRTVWGALLGGSFKKGPLSLTPQRLRTEEAVISEPVSGRWFPVSRENTGKFANLGLEIAKAPRLSEENSITYQQNSLVAKAGKIYGPSRNPKRVTANLIPITGSRVWRHTGVFHAHCSRTSSGAAPARRAPSNGKPSLIDGPHAWLGIA